jgi:hypothetical protein
MNEERKNSLALATFELATKILDAANDYENIGLSSREALVTALSIGILTAAGDYPETVTDVIDERVKKALAERDAARVYTSEIVDNGRAVFTV